MINIKAVVIVMVYHVVKNAHFIKMVFIVAFQLTHLK